VCGVCVCVCGVCVGGVCVVCVCVWCVFVCVCGVCGGCVCVVCVCVCVCVKIACFLSELIFTFLSAVSSTQNTSELVVSFIPLSFVHFALHPNPQTKV